MTLYQIISLFVRCISNTSLSDWKRKFPEVDYQMLTDFFKQNFNPQELIKQSWSRLFSLMEGWLILDEIVLEKSKKGKLKLVKRRYKSAGGYITPGISIVLLLWTNGSIRIPLRFHIWRPTEGSHTEAAMKLLSWFRNSVKVKPLCVLFDAGFCNQKFLKRLDDYGWCFVCRLPKTRLFNGIPIWRFKKQGYWNDIGYLNSGLKVKAVRIKDKFYITNKVSLSRERIIEWYGKRAEIEEVFKILKHICHWKGCRFRDDNKYERFLSVGVVTFMCWEKARTEHQIPITIHKLRRNVMFDNYDLHIPDLDEVLDVA